MRWRSPMERNCILLPRRIRISRLVARCGCTCRRSDAGFWLSKTRNCVQEELREASRSVAMSITRRSVLKGAAAFAAGASITSVRAEVPASPITPELIAAAQKEGKVAWYTSVDLPVAEKLARAFE